MFEGSFLLVYFLHGLDGQIYHKNDGHDANVPSQIVPSGYGTFFDTSNQSLEKLNHTKINLPL